MLILVFLIVLALIVIYLLKEGFDPEYVDTEKIMKSSQASPTASTVISNGDVQKYKEDGYYFYNLFFNLPSIGSSFQTTNLDLPFNSPLASEEYVVTMGTSESDMQKIGVLKRQPNGYHTLETKSEKDYTRVCVHIGRTLVSCVNF